LATGGESGSVHLIDLLGRKIINNVKLASAVNAIKFITAYANIIVAGCQDGSISVMSVPELKIIATFHDSDSSMESLLPLRNGFLAGKYDGSCLWYNLENNSNQRIVLSGSDVDPIFDISTDQESIFTASRDGSIRKYCIREMFS
jgi:WD40 repeat protein